MTPRSALRIGFLSCLPLLAALAVAPAADAPIPFLFPVFESDGDEFLGLSIVNTAAAVNTVTVTWTSGDGRSSRGMTLSLQPGTQRVFLIREILGTPAEPRDGWIRIEASEAGLVSYLTSGSDRLFDGVDAVSATATSILLQHVDVNTGFAELDHRETFVTLVNPGGGIAEARVDLVGLDGKGSGTLSIQVPPAGTRTVRVSEAFRETLPANGFGGRTFAGYMRIQANTGLAGWLRIDTPLSRRLLRGRPTEEIGQASLAMAGHFAYGSAALYRSTLNLVNAGDAPARLELTAQDNRGSLIGNAVRLALNPGQGIREDVLNLFHVVVPAIFPPGLITGYIRIRNADAGSFRLVGDVGIHTDRMAAAMLYPISTASARDWTIPFAVSGPGYYTGYAFANPNELLTVQTDVTVEVFDPTGRLAGAPRTVSLSPAARFDGLVEKDLPSGYLRIRANGPLFPLGSIGTSSGSALAFLPAAPR